MSLQSQIELMNNPQEFTRLYNAVMTIKYGNDFLPIDDDQQDGGNDGYVKSEKRIYAGHCFKRIQKQGINQAILDKMMDDLDKAIKLKKAKRWPIENWTFLSNYPISEEVGQKVFTKGRDEGIEVSWHGAEYFANALHASNEVRAQFPSLIAPDLQVQLDAILKKLDGSDNDEPIKWVPTNEHEQALLLAQKPPYWEYLYFASVLLLGKERLELKWHDHTLGHARANGQYVSKEGVGPHIRAVFPQLSMATSSVEGALSEESTELAFGKPGEPGDSKRIEHIATHVVNVYEDMMDWSARLRATVFPDEYEDLVSATAHLADTPVNETRDFITHVVGQVNKIYPHIEGEHKDEPLHLNMVLALSIDDEAMARYQKEIKKMKRRRLWF
ncbi:MAG TPA: hypothetical protein VLA92_05250 [Candidatus Saccharimonadales bacterium]|nr:hypothetical protein [Candidatus Saccharimonadales bacterium]